MNVISKHQDLSYFYKNIHNIELVYYIPVGAKSQNYNNSTAHLLFLSKSYNDHGHRNFYMMPVRSLSQGHSTIYNKILMFVEDLTNISIEEFTQESFHYIELDEVNNEFKKLGLFP